MGLGLLVSELMRAVDWNLVEMIQRINHLFVAPIGALFFAGIIFRRVGAAAAWLGFVSGVVTAFVVSFSKQIFDMERGIAFAWIMPAAFVVSLSVSFLTGFLFRPPTDEQLASMYRGSHQKTMYMAIVSDRIARYQKAGFRSPRIRWRNS